MTSAALSAEHKSGAPRGSLGALSLGALGVVYGDIGTSPLYTIKTALEWEGGNATPEVALGILSLIVWTLIITTSIKYVAVVMRADNEGEGGILALMSLLGIKHGNRVAVTCDLGAERARRPEDRGARDRALRGHRGGRDPDRAVRPAAAGQRTHRQAVRSGHDGLVRHDRRARHRRRNCAS
jgi:hypothetical protein